MDSVSDASTASTLSTIAYNLSELRNQTSHERTGVVSMPGNQVRIKFEFKQERKIILMSRPLQFMDLKAKIKSIYSVDLTVFYFNAELKQTLSITCQADIDKALLNLDRSPAQKSLRIILIQPSDPVTTVAMPTSQFSLSIASNNRGVQQNSFFPARSNSQPFFPSSPVLNSPRLSPRTFPGKTADGFHPIDDTNPPMHPYHPGGRDSPPPGLTREPPGRPQSMYSERAKELFKGGGGMFIAEDDPVGVLPEPEQPPGSYVRKIKVAPSPNSSGSTTDISQTSESSGYRNYDDPPSRPGTYPTRRHTFDYNADPEKFRTFPRRHKKTRRAVSDVYLAESAASPESFTPDFYSSKESLSQAGYLDAAMAHLSELNLSSDLLSKPDDWTKGRVLGSGAFGTVYMCHDRNTGRELAVKQVDITHANDMQAQKEVQALETEMEIYRNLKHDRVVQYYGTERTECVLSIFMEYMPGSSIHNLLKEHGPLTETLTRKYTRQIVEGVAYLHSKCVVHRDIKGANILRDSSGNVKLSDFGASKRLQTIRTMSGYKSVHGTPYWMSPEVINGKGYGRKADIWSLGCTVVEMLTTKPPWHELEAIAALFKIATEATKPDLPDHVSECVRDFIAITLIMDKETRPSADKLLDHGFVSGVL
ncbi:mitogen-activated protein kinase kinase kinase 3-like [Oscarella lobularis]|uniref:mitogen-activated protein kinase kinase kinase 3-like n=1 Tax=Oscarella lobularis TaxID=121494 RepID=UPI003313EC0C